jgi:cell division protein FtsW
MIKRRLKSFDYSLLIVYVLLSIFGLIMVYSASMITSIQIYEVESNFFFKRQLMFLMLSYVMCIVAAILPYKKYKNNIFLMVMIFMMFALLIGLFLRGQTVNNATSWISIMGVSFQPAEFVKLALIIYLAAVYSKKQPYINDFNKGVVPPVVILCLFCFLIVLQPDIGTAAIIFATGAIIVFCAGMNWKNLFKLSGIGIFLIFIFISVMSLTGHSFITETRMARFTSFMDPFKYELDEGLQLVNSYVAIGSGGLTGVGLGKSIQKLGYLPEAHTDFIMAIIAEELGVLGVGFVLFCLGFIVLKGFHLGMKCKDAFGSLLAFGISGLIGIQTFINLGGVAGLIPITGVTLPFVSYGGTSLMVLSICIGLLMSVSSRANLEMKEKEKLDS